MELPSAASGFQGCILDGMDMSAYLCPETIHGMVLDPSSVLNPEIILSRSLTISLLSATMYEQSMIMCLSFLMLPDSNYHTLLAAFLVSHHLL